MSTRQSPTRPPIIVLPPLTGAALDALLAWGQEGYRWARDHGFQEADAEDVRQSLFLEYLSPRRHVLKRRFVVLRAITLLKRQPPLHRSWWDVRSSNPTPAWDAAFDVQRIWTSLGKGQQACLRHWLATDEDAPTLSPTQKRRKQARLRILGNLRAALALPAPARKEDPCD